MAGAGVTHRVLCADKYMHPAEIRETIRMQETRPGQTMIDNREILTTVGCKSLRDTVFSSKVE